MHSESFNKKFTLKKKKSKTPPIKKIYVKMSRYKNNLMSLTNTKLDLILLLQIIFASLSATLTVDNELVSARSDCFERIALEAMLPFQKSFNTEDTNSLKNCKERCIQAGDKCQSLSFGVHRRGNGTCQLSTEKFSLTGGRPSGIIFDPDFDLYVRKSNCFDLSDNTITDTTVGGGAGAGDEGVEAYGSLSPTPTVQLPNRPADPGTTLLVVDPTPTTSTTFSHERPATGYSPSPSPTYGTTPGVYTDSVNPTLGATTPDGDRLYFSQDIYPLYKYPTLYEHNYPAPNDDIYIPGGYASNVPEVHDVYRPPGQYPTGDTHAPPHGPPRPIFGLGYGNGFSYGRPESYDPTTVRPYDQNSQADRDRDTNRPSVYTTRPGPPTSDRPDRPGSYPNERPNSYPSDRPDSYSSERPNAYPSQRPSSYPSDRPDRPSSYPNDRPERPGSYPNDRPNHPDSYPSVRPDQQGSYPNDHPDRPLGPPNSLRPTRPDYDPTTPTNYYTRPDYDGLNRRPSYEQRPSSSALPPMSNGQRPPGDYIDYTSRPDPPNGHGLSTSMRPPMREPGGYGGMSNGDYGYVRRNGTAARPDGGYDGDKTIATFFNPEDYLNGSKRRPGSGYDDRDEGSMDQMKACFRRVLAGKRISPRWVRRTFACERVEDCMRQCGIEKRFMCEGFNYRLDPSGHGQGDCELIEIPLAQMDLYSSASQRDSNLLRHPDYDYYERDRNAPPSCRRSPCRECSTKGGTLSSPPLYLKPSGWADKPPYRQEHHYLPSPPSASGYGSDEHRYRPPSSTAIDRYHPSGLPPPPSASISYDNRPPPLLPPSSSSSSSSEYHHSGAFDFSSHDSAYFEHMPPSGYGSSGTGSGPIDRYDYIRPEDHHRYRPGKPDRWESIPSSPGYDSAHYRPSPESDRFRPPYRPGPDYSPYRPSSHELSGPSGSADSYRPPPPPPPPLSTHNYLDRDGPPLSSYKGSTKFVPYLIGEEKDWGSYGGSYGGSYNKQSAYWGLSDYNRRRDPHDFNYFELGGTRHGSTREPNSVLSYPGSSYGGFGAAGFKDRHDYKHSWTRRPGPDECSAKIGEGFRLHKTAIKHSTSVPTLVECEQLCSGQDGFSCHTYSYRYSPAGRDNCMLCDRPINSLDYYVDIEPDRDYDIYSMSDDLDVCRKPSRSDEPPGHYGSRPGTALADPRNAQCFFRAIDATRFYKSIVRDSLTVRSVGECEMECIKSVKFTCRAFAYRYGQQRHASVIDNCQLSDWPVRDMDKERHLIKDTAFDVFERASYGHGCEIQPIVDDKHKKSVCYLGYGSPAKLLSTAIKKVISVPSELACKKECIRFRETTSFKCYSFSYGSRATSFNCELSDLDQTELKLNIHYTHTDDRDFWLFAWNPFDWTCRDKVNTIGGSRVNNDRRMDIFREPGDVAWRHYTVTGKACRTSSPCEKNLVTGFYSCEIEGGEIGSWDYCCKAEHPCGYSQGFDYPWCFVGDEADQWRKCSDRYYPGNKTTTNAHAHSSLKFASLKSDNKNKKHGSESSTTSTKNEYQRPPRPGGLQGLSDFAAARLWPVTYLYSEGPPNSTEFSNFVDCNKESC